MTPSVASKSPTLLVCFDLLVCVFSPKKKKLPIVSAGATGKGRRRRDALESVKEVVGNDEDGDEGDMNPPVSINVHVQRHIEVTKQGKVTSSDTQPVCCVRISFDVFTSKCVSNL